MSSRPKPGDEFPPIEGQTPDGPLRIADYRGAKHVVLWTYPMDATPG